MTEDDVRELLRNKIAGKPLRAAGRELGVTAPWLCMVLAGKRAPSGKILDAIGVARRPKGPTRKGLAFTTIDCHE